MAEVMALRTAYLVQLLGTTKGHGNRSAQHVIQGLPIAVFPRHWPTSLSCAMVTSLLPGQAMGLARGGVVSAAAAVVGGDVPPLATRRVRTQTSPRPRAPPGGLVHLHVDNRNAPVALHNRGADRGVVIIVA